MIPLTNYDFQWARSELVIIYPETMPLPWRSNDLEAGHFSKDPGTRWCFDQRLSGPEIFGVDLRGRFLGNPNDGLGET